MNKIKVTFFVSPMGHDVVRICKRVSEWMKNSGAFEVTVAGTYYPDAKCSIEEFVLNPELMANTDLFFFLCSDANWKNPNVRKALENAVENGTGVLFFHGLHPCFGDWEGAERMIGHLWRESASHGDFNWCEVKMTEHKHPITEGVEGFKTKEELFCGLSNVWNVQKEVLATAYSDKNLISRHGHPGTGKDEPILTTGNYGKGRTVNFILGHVWEYYTGHGLFENTLIALEPKQFKILLLRSCEWAVTGKVEKFK
ncbi:MAG: hypothetical protein K0S55_2087 [Clostridia bacterium]|jgi:type 1 glutamine amidotransferase|nr:hypothetical protein [Clostridia bacterium]